MNEANFIVMLKRWINPLRVRVSNITGKGIVTKSSDSQGLQTLQIKMAKDETRDNVPRLQNYGLTSFPDEGSQIVAIFPDGNREGGVVIALDDYRYRVTLNKGEVSLYSKFGNKIVMKSDGSIEATPASGKSFKVNGNLEATGDISTLTGDVKAGVTSLKLHTHTSAVSGSPTSPPI